MVRASPVGFGRVFAYKEALDLADELRTVGVCDAMSTARDRAQAAVKLVVPLQWRECFERAVASLPSLALYAQPRGGDSEHFLLFGSLHELNGCARALCQPDNPAAPLGCEILNQLQHIDSPSYGRLECGGRSVNFALKTGIMGILNVTPDSFYDGGRYLDPQAALDRAHQMVEDGADIIDIGGQSTRPGADPVPEDEEYRRVLPVVAAAAMSLDAMISVDTWRAGVARAALEVGAHIVNDVSALRFDPALLAVVAERKVPLILMHMKGTPRDMHLNPTYEALIDEVFTFLQERIRTAHAGGVPLECLLIDPGIGFGKGARHNLEVLRKLHHFRALGRPIVIGTSRKSFIGRLLGTGVDERLEGTAATVAHAIAQGASVIRVHDVKEMARVARMMDAIVRPGFAVHGDDPEEHQPMETKE